MLIALGLALCFRSNVWNIGAEGQFIFGALFGGRVAMQATEHSSRFIVVLILCAGVVGGMVWAGVVALLRDRFHTSEILVSLMLVSWNACSVHLPRAFGCPGLHRRRRSCSVMDNPR